MAGIWPAVSIHRTIGRAVAVGLRRILPIVETRGNERRRREGWDPIIQIKGGDHRGTAHAGSESLVQVKPVQRHSTAPAGVKGLCKEDPVSGTHHCLRVDGIGHAKPRREPLVPRLLRIVRAVTGVAIAVASKGQSPGPACGTGIGSHQVNK